MVNAAWDGISALIESAAAFVILGERFSDPNQYIGLGLIVSGLFFLHIFTFTVLRRNADPLGRRLLM
jgi:multidrug transporter EmrE-like cation transporter